MAAGRGYDWGAFIAGAVVLLIILVAIAAVVIFGGLYPVGASTADPPGMAKVLIASREHSVERQASDLQAPKFSPADIREGGSHFKGMCQECHGGPGAEPEEFAAGMNPRPPDLARAAGDLSTEEVFWIAKNGLKMSGMPAFGKTDSDSELWKVAAFVKQMPKVTPHDYAALPNAHEHEHSGGS